MTADGVGRRMPGIFVYEHLSGGPLSPAEATDPAVAEWRPQGTAMRDALVADLARLPGLAVTCAVNDTADEALVARLATGPGTSVGTAWAVPGETAVDFVRRQAAAHALAWVVAPESDGLLATLQAAVPPARWLGCDAAALALASSKTATVAALAARGIATPLAFAEGGAPGLRWIAKPDDGAGAVDARVFAHEAAAREGAATLIAAGRRMCVEPWVPGEALSITVLAGEGWVQALAFNRQHIEVSAEGWLAFHGVEPNALAAAGDPRVVRLHLLALEVARAVPGLFGLVGIDLVWHPERGPVVIEVNPRLTSAYVGLSARLGRNLADEVLRAHAAAVSRHG